MSAQPLLKLVPEIDLIEDRQEVVKSLADLVDDLMATCDDLREEREKLRLALGLSRLEYAELRDRGFALKVIRLDADHTTKTKAEEDSVLLKESNDALAALTDKLEKYLGG